jgi:hypothetical protein
MNTDALEKSLNRIHEWIRAVDQKINICLVFETAVILTIALPTFHFLKANFTDLSRPAALMLCFGAASLMAAVLKLIGAIKPNLKVDSPSITFFGGIAKLSLVQYKTAVSQTSTSKYKKELTEQTYYAAKISNKKHTWLGQSITLFISGMILWIIFLMIFVKDSYAH